MRRRNTASVKRQIQRLDERLYKMQRRLHDAEARIEMRLSVLRTAARRRMARVQGKLAELHMMIGE